MIQYLVIIYYQIRKKSKVTGKLVSEINEKGLTIKLDQRNINGFIKKSNIS